MEIMKKVKLTMSLYRLLPAYILICLSGAKKVVLEDADFWNGLFGRKDKTEFQKIGLLL